MANGIIFLVVYYVEQIFANYRLSESVSLCALNSLADHIASFEHSQKKNGLFNYTAVYNFVDNFIDLQMFDSEIVCICPIDNYSIHELVIITRLSIRIIITIYAYFTCITALLVSVYVLMTPLRRVDSYAHQQALNTHENNKIHLVSDEPEDKEEWGLEELYEEPFIDTIAESHMHATQAQFGEGRDCVICLESPRHVTLLPCKHLCVCRKCLPATADQCPICRQAIDDVLVAFVP